MTKRQRDKGKCSLTGNDLYSMFLEGTADLRQNVTAINSLNVFPVPDGDTGTNMLLTMEAVLTAGYTEIQASADQVARSLAHGALLGSRGNSGVILSQFFRGFAEALEGKTNADERDLVKAFEKASVCAYQAVTNPVEGTILTCINQASLGAAAAWKSTSSLEDIWVGASHYAKIALEKTPELLPILKEAGVVDAGGQGFCVLLQGALRHLRAGHLALEVTGSQTALQIVSSGVKETFLTATESNNYGYCTQFIVTGVNLDTEKIRTDIAAMGDSTVIVGDESTVKVHVHVLDPDSVLSYGVKHGLLSQVQIDDINTQHKEFLDFHRANLTISGCAVVCIAIGEGLIEISRSLGATQVVVGGQTMNPSTSEILEAVEATNAEAVIILPNNKNIIGSAEQVHNLTGKAIAVVPTTSIPQGIAALLVFNSDLSLETNLSAMIQSSQTVHTGEVTYAVRDSALNGLRIKKGHAIGILDGGIVESSVSRQQVVLSLSHRMRPEAGSIITIYFGAHVPQEEASQLAKQLREHNPQSEVETVMGGQPNSEYILSVE